MAAGEGILLEIFNHISQLVNAEEIPPLLAVNRTKIAVLGGKLIVFNDPGDELIDAFTMIVFALAELGIRPFVPDPDLVSDQGLNIGRTADEPQQFISDGFKVYFLGS